MIPYNVIWYNGMTRVIESYDVMPYLMDRYEGTSKLDRPRTFEEVKKFVLRHSQYQWWSRCEYEIIVSSWPNGDAERKLDIYYQIKMNIDIVTEVMIRNIENRE